MGVSVPDLLAQLQSSAFRDIAGARASGRIPISSALINRVVAEALQGTKAPIRAIDVRPKNGDQFDLVITVTWPFVPALKGSFTVEQQPKFPGAPVVVLRWSLLGAAGALASRVFNAFGKLPPGVRLEPDRLLLDIPMLVGPGLAASALPYVRSLELHTADDRAVLDIEVAVE
jgi:hypothetical protein